MNDSSLATSQALDANSPETQPSVFAATTREAEDRCDRVPWSDMDARTNLEPIFTRPRRQICSVSEHNFLIARDTTTGTAEGASRVPSAKMNGL